MQENTQSALQPNQTYTCPTCGAELPEPNGFCPLCGTSTTPTAPTVTRFCGGCGTKLEGHHVFCPKCGKRFEDAAAASENTHVPPAPTVDPNHAPTVNPTYAPTVNPTFNPTVVPIQPAPKKKNRLVPIIAIVAVVIVAILAVVLLSGTPVTSISLKDSEVTLAEGDTYKLSFSIKPSDATNKDVTWESSDEDVATVSSTGKVTAVSEGECTITVTSHNGKTDECEITVKAAGPDFKALYNEYCTSTWAEVGSDGSYLSIDTNPYDWDDSGVAYWEAYTAVENVNSAIGLPDYVLEDMGATSASMGRQTQNFPELGVTVTWTYHPDEGLEVTYKYYNEN